MPGSFFKRNPTAGVRRSPSQYRSLACWQAFGTYFGTSGRRDAHVRPVRAAVPGGSVWRRRDQHFRSLQHPYGGDFLVLEDP